MYWELRRRGYQVRYLRHPKTDYEVDFIAYRTFEEPELAIQVTCQMDDQITMEREIRSLANLTAPAFAKTRRLVLTQRPKPVAGIDVANVMEWLL